jgi:hypothetical protein
VTASRQSSPAAADRDPEATGAICEADRLTKGRDIRDITSGNSLSDDGCKGCFSIAPGLIGRLVWLCARS